MSTYSGSQCIKSCLWLNDNKSLFWILVKTQKYISKFHNNYFSFDEAVSLPSYFYLLASFIKVCTQKRKCESYTKILRKYFHGHSGIMKSLDLQYNALSSIKIVKFYIQFLFQKHLSTFSNLLYHCILRFWYCIMVKEILFTSLDSK